MRLSSHVQTNLFKMDRMVWILPKLLGYNGNLERTVHPDDRMLL